MEEKKLIDDCFYVKQGRFLWDSYDLDGKGLVSALTEEDCISGTRFLLKGRQEGWNDANIKSYSTKDNYKL